MANEALAKSADGLKGGDVYMTKTEELIKKGQRIYTEKIVAIRGATIGKFDGALPYFKERAIHLLEIDESLNDEARRQMLTWLGEGVVPEPKLENALVRIENRLRTIRNMNRIASLQR